MGQQHLGRPGLPAHRGPTEALGTALFLALGSPSAAPYLLQVSSAPLYSLYFLRITLCVSYRYAHLCSTCLSGALEEADGSVELELQMVVSCYSGFWELNLGRATSALSC